MPSTWVHARLVARHARGHSSPYTVQPFLPALSALRPTACCVCVCSISAEYVSFPGRGLASLTLLARFIPSPLRLYRGKFRSKPWAAVLEEARHLVDEGARELNLIAEDTNQYGMDR